MDKDAHPIHMKMTVVAGFSTEAIEQWTRQHVAAGSVVEPKLGSQHFALSGDNPMFNPAN